jgi:hypothetical protein
MVKRLATKRLLASIGLALLVASCGGESSNTGEAPARGGSAGASSGGSDAHGGRSGVDGDASASGGAVATGGAVGEGGAAGAGPGGAGKGAAAGTGGEPDDDPELVPCNSSDGSGCDAGELCVDESDACLPELEVDCTGFCARRLPVRACKATDNTPCPDGYDCVPRPPQSSGVPEASTCVEDPTACESDGVCPTGFRCVIENERGVCAPDRVSCSGPVTCPAIAPPCPTGFVRSTPGGCFGPCVRVDHCACDNDHDCLPAPATCDRMTGTCGIARAPAPRCLVPLDATLSCGNPRRTWFTFADGRCQEVTSEYCSQPNEFMTLEECQTHCQGMPIEAPCSEGLVPATICIACGPVGGCAAMAEICTPVCTDNTPCTNGALCLDGICQVYGCV